MTHTARDVLTTTDLDQCPNCGIEWRITLVPGVSGKGTWVETWTRFTGQRWSLLRCAYVSTRLGVRFEHWKSRRNFRIVSRSCNGWGTK